MTGGLSYRSQYWNKADWTRNPKDDVPTEVRGGFVNSAKFAPTMRLVSTAALGLFEQDELLLALHLSLLLPSCCTRGFGVRTCRRKETCIDRIAFEAFGTFHLSEVPDPVVMTKPLGNVSQYGFNFAGAILYS